MISGLMSFRGRSAPAVAIGTLLGLLALTPVSTRAQQRDTTRSRVETLDLSQSGAGEGLTDLTAESANPLQVTGFGVGDYTYRGRTSENTFAAGKLAVALFRELSDSFWFFGQLTTALSEEGGDAGEGAVPTEIEIDNLLVAFTPPGATNVNISFGKFDTPIGFERDDEPLNLAPTESFNFELARPAKMVGLIGRWSVSPAFDVAGWVANGWDSQIDPNHGKTVGLRLGAIPTEHTSFGVAGLFGPEGEAGATLDRYLLTFDYALEPTSDVIVAGEANYGGDRGALEGGSDAVWYGGLLTLFGRLSPHVGITARGEALRDRDGARTGEVQTLRSLTLAPVYLVGTGREGIFANVEHTTFRIPRIQIRAGIRYDHSSVDFFEGPDGPARGAIRYLAEAVVTF